MKRIFLIFFSFVLMTSLAINFVFYPVMEKIFLKIYRDEILVPHRDFFKGFFHVMTEDLLEIDSSRWPDQLNDWKLHFGIDVDILPMAPSHFSHRELDGLAEGKIMMRGDVNIAGNQFYQRIGGTGFALQIGGTSSSGRNFDEIIEGVVIWSVVIVYVSIPALIWAYPFWRKLKRVRAAALAFGRGDLERRVRIPRYSGLYPIAEAFNQMADRIQRLIAAHRQLNSAVSRELRKPVSRIRLRHEMLAVGSEEAAVPDDMDAMRKDIDEFDSLISRLLTYARYDGSLLRFSTEPHPLVPWLTEIVDYMDVELAGKYFTLHDQIEQHSLSVWFDPRHMGRAIANILRNAATHSRSRVELTVMRQNNSILLHIDDDGPGIPAEEQRGIFEPFARPDVGGRRNSSGFGLGLATVKRIMQRHNGNAAVGESPLGGSRFTLKWPGLTAEKL